MNGTDIALESRCSLKEFEKCEQFHICHVGLVPKYSRSNKALGAILRHDE